MSADNTSDDDAHRAHQGGFYTKGDFFDNDTLPGVAEARQMVGKAVVDYIRQVTGRKDLPSHIQIISWAALTHANDYQTLARSRRSSTLSGVYYAVAPPTAGTAGLH